MAKSKSTRADFIAERFGQIDRDLLLCRATLRCAAEALGNAEDEGFKGDGSMELAASAIRVVERCSEELVRIEDAFDRLRMEAQS
jgi:hypothetical protein